MSFENVLFTSLSSKKHGVRKAKDERNDHNINDEIPNKFQCENTTLGSVDVPVSNVADNFRKNITEREVKIIFFILESSRSFQALNIKEKIATVMKKCEFKLQEYIFNKIINDNIVNYEGYGSVILAQNVILARNYFFLILDP
ncbi:hypothetical protein DMUE_2878 [Dictyocoela muelleri]|nr:hypothetical protein DMUE_2878 [Dictyocoela muelleri]